MNNQRRKVIRKVLSDIASITLKTDSFDNLEPDSLETIRDIIQDILDEEQDSFDNMPENLQGSERGENSENAIASLEDALNSLEDALNAADSEEDIDEVLDYISDAEASLMEIY